MTALDGVLAAFALLSLLTAAASVLSRQVVHAALWLVVCLGSLAGVYLVLGAEVVALVQLLVYVGAVVVLVLFALMLTTAPLRPADLDSPPATRALAAVIGLAAAALIGAALIVGQPLAADVPVVDGRAAPLGLELFSFWVLGFELISVLLLATLIGAVAVSRRRPTQEIR